MRTQLNCFISVLIVGAAFLSFPASTKAQTNLAANGSFEILGGTNLFSDWDNNGGVEGHVNEMGANGSKNFVVLSSGARIWQDVPTVTGRTYIVRFALKFTSGPIRLLWNGVSVAVTNYASNINAVWADALLITPAATGAVSRVEFQGEGGAVLDDVRVGWLEEPPSVQTQVASRSTFEGGTVTFKANAIGGPPLAYQWLLDGNLIPNATNSFLVLTNARHSDENDQYVVTITNSFGKASSLPATLRVLAMPKEPLIVTQPKNAQMTAGYSAGFYVFAVGDLPLAYEWRFNDVAIPGATNSHFSIQSAGLTNAGNYSVLVSNKFGTALSIPAALSVQTGLGGGYVDWENSDFFSFDAPIFDVDGTLLPGPKFVAQLYAGATSNSLHAVGSSVVFESDYPGYYFPPVARIPDVFAGATAYLQVRVWDQTFGDTFEESQALGGSFGKSEAMPVVLRTELSTPQPLLALHSFSVQSGQPSLATAKLYPGSQLPDNTKEWVLVGEVGSQYVIEHRAPPNDWLPLLLVTNMTGTLTFVDTNAQNSSFKFYRARIVEP